MVGWLEEHLGGCGLTGAARREAGAGSPDDPDTGRRWPQAWPTVAVRGGLTKGPDPGHVWKVEAQDLLRE